MLDFDVSSFGYILRSLLVQKGPRPRSFFVPKMPAGGACVSVRALRGKVSCHLGAKEYDKVILYNKLHTRDSLGGGNPRKLAASA